MLSSDHSILTKLTLCFQQYIKPLGSRTVAYINVDLVLDGKSIRSEFSQDVIPKNCCVKGGYYRVRELVKEKYLITILA